MSECTFCGNEEGLVFVQGLSKTGKPYRALDCPECKKRTFILKYIMPIEEWEHLRKEENENIGKA